MSTYNRNCLRYLIAALLLLSAAICAVAQSGPAVKQSSGQASKQNTREDKPTSPSKQNARDAQTPSTAPLKQNTREAATEKTSASAQTPLPENGPPTNYSYEFKQPDFYIKHILIEHDAGGHGRISFERRGEDVPVTEPLELSEAARARIDALWVALRFMDSDRNYQAERQYPHLGTMWLRMKRGTLERTAEFNWTNDKDAAALVDEYKRAAEQALFVFDISVARENQPLEAPKLMDKLETLLKRGGLSDPQQLIPLLRDLTTDEHIPLMARNQAERILKKIQK